MLFSRYASNLLKMCRFVNLDLRLSTDVRRMIYRKDSSVLDLFNICGFNNSSTDVRQMLNGVLCGQQQIVQNNFWTLTFVILLVKIHIYPEICKEMAKDVRFHLLFL